MHRCTPATCHHCHCRVAKPASSASHLSTEPGVQRCTPATTAESRSPRRRQAIYPASSRLLVPCPCTTLPRTCHRPCCRLPCCAHGHRPCCRLPSRVMGETEHAAPFPHTHLAWSDLRIIPPLCESSQESSQGRLCDYALPKPRHGEDRVYAAPFLPTHLAWSDCRSNPTLCEFSQESLHAQTVRL